MGPLVALCAGGLACQVQPVPSLGEGPGLSLGGGHLPGCAQPGEVTETAANRCPSRATDTTTGEPPLPHKARVGARKEIKTAQNLRQQVVGGRAPGRLGKPCPVKADDGTAGGWWLGAAGAPSPGCVLKQCSPSSPVGTHTDRPAVRTEGRCPVSGRPATERLEFHLFLLLTLHPAWGRLPKASASIREMLALQASSP